MSDSKEQTKETAILGGGCFWCVEAIFSKLRGVCTIEPGYAGGHTSNPSYEQVCSGTTGHAEVCRVVFDPDQLSFDLLLDVFFQVHNPTTLNRQGEDIGSQYRSVIFPTSSAQQTAASNATQRWNQSGVFDDPIVTTIEQHEVFYPAEDYHFNYFSQNPDKAYCSAVISPKISKFTTKFSELLKT